MLPATRGAGRLSAGRQMNTGRPTNGRPERADGPVAYLDHAATTPMCAEAVAAMLPFLADHYGNPSGSHRVAAAALRALDDAREELAFLLGASAGEIVFTSGGTEADNLAVLGFATGPDAVLCSAVEHPGVLEACRAAGGHTIGVDGRGVIDLDALSGALDERVHVVSVMLVNNETGVVQPLDEVVSLVREQAPGAVVHSDAVQAFAWLELGSALAGVELLSVSGHKIGGPKGIGALVVRKDAHALRPLFHGGPQERERRAGTQNVAGAVAMAAAAKGSCARPRARPPARRRAGPAPRRRDTGGSARCPRVRARGSAYRGHLQPRGGRRRVRRASCRPRRARCLRLGRLHVCERGHRAEPRAPCYGS